MFWTGQVACCTIDAAIAERTVVEKNNTDRSGCPQQSRVINDMTVIFPCTGFAYLSVLGDCRTGSSTAATEAMAANIIPILRVPAEPLCQLI